MTAPFDVRTTRPARASRLGLTTFCTALAVACALAAPPNNPLPAPFYSFDVNSPTVTEGFVGAADILAVSDPHPVVIVPGWRLGLPDPLDDLDGLSERNVMIPPSMYFLLLFSVDRATVGVAPPDPYLISLGVPYNAMDQAWRGQAAGDEFLSLQYHTFGARQAAGGLRVTNNVLVRNNFDEGGTDFAAEPPTHASDSATVRVPQDNVDSISAALAQPPFAVNVHFTAAASSPSLAFLPNAGWPSGAHIYFNPEPLADPPPATQLFAPFWELGLVQADDVDAMIVFDLNANGFYDGADRVLFSLAPGSPSLETLPGASPVGAAADVFIAGVGQPTELFMGAAEFGLGQYSDNIDALDALLCQDALVCAHEYGIRALRGDMNCDDIVDFLDINPFVLAIVSPTGYQEKFPYCHLMRADCNHDGSVGFPDINAFVDLLSGN